MVGQHDRSNFVPSACGHTAGTRFVLFAVVLLAVSGMFSLRVPFVAASSSVSIGQAVSDGSACQSSESGLTSLVQESTYVSPGGGYTVPSYVVPAGINQITSWSTAAGTDPGLMALEIWQPTSTPGTYRLVGASSIAFLSPSLTYPYKIDTFTLSPPITVAPGDLLGADVDGGDCAATSNGLSGDLAGFSFDEEGLSSTPSVGYQTAFEDGNGIELDIQATGISATSPLPLVTGVTVLPALSYVGQSTTLNALITASPIGSPYLTSAAYNINGGAWQALSPADGGEFGEPTPFPVTATVPGQTVPGTYTLCVRGTDQDGNTSDGTACAPWLILPDIAPSISSSPSTTFTVDDAHTFTVETAGVPEPTLTDGGATLPSGVTFIDNGNGTATLSGKPAPGTEGTYSFTIISSNGTLPEATQLFTLKVALRPDTVTIVPTPRSAFQEIPITLTATVTQEGGHIIPSGEISFLSAGQQIPGCINVPLQSGVGRCTTTNLAVGADPVSATYSGDRIFASGIAATSVVVSDLTDQAVSVSVTATPKVITQGGAITITATVIAATGNLIPTGAVSFSDAPIVGCQNLPLVKGMATCTTTSLSVGSDPITALYTGDATFASGDARTTVTVSAVAVATTRVLTPDTGVGEHDPAWLLALLLVAAGGALISWSTRLS